MGKAISPSSAREEAGLWRPLPFLDTLRNATRHRPTQGLLLLWILSTVVCVVLGIYQVKFAWNALPVNLGPIHFSLTIYPPLVICLWILFWLGFTWAFVAAYLATFTLALYSGMRTDLALLFALVDPLALAVYALAYRIARIPFDLRSFKSAAWFLLVSFVAAVGGSVGSFVWSSVHGLSSAETFAIWQGWWLGALVQAAILNAPILALVGSRLELVKRRYFRVRPVPMPSFRWITVAIATGGVVFVGFLLATNELASVRLSAALNPVSEATRAAITSATYSWTLTVWISMVLTLASCVGGISLAYAWNQSLTSEVAARTAELKESEQRFRVTFDQAAVGITHVATDGKWLRVNQKFCEIVQYAQAELRKLTFQEITYPEDLNTDLGFVEKMLAGEIPTYSMQKRYIQKGGALIWVKITVSLARGQDGEPKYFISIVEDITESKQLEEQLRQSQKMEAIGRLAGGVAHDFNNLLTIIGGYGQMLLMELAADDPNREHVQAICRAADRAAALTKQLLAFSRRQVVQAQVVNLCELVLNMQGMLHRLIGENVELSVTVSPVPARVKVDPGQMEQVIVNLAVNARDAMPGGGKLTLEVSHLEIERVPQVMLSVQDNGAGMTDEVQSHLFEPFFTTKPKGQGTGLGLSIVYGIVKQFGGSIIVRSEPEKGSSFQIYIPPALETEQRHDAPKTAEPAKRGSETILLVEDEEALRKLAAQVLRSRGYTVLEAESGEDAMEVFQRFKRTIPLLVTDMIMPGMNGRVLAESLRGSRPEMKVLYISGYTENVLDLHGSFGPGTAFLQKPFSPAVLTQKVRELLDQVA